MKVLVIDIGGSRVKVLVSGEAEARKFDSGPKMTPEKMIAGLQRIASDWTYDVVSIGYPGPVLQNVPISEPHNLGRGWLGFDFEAAFGKPVKLINDAAMQALGSYKGGRMLFLGLGTGLGSALIIDGKLQPLELAHLPYKNGTFEDYVGLRGLEKYGKKKWRKHVFDVAQQLKTAMQADYVVLGGGNVKQLKKLPEGAVAGDNANAFKGGFRLWNAPAR